VIEQLELGITGRPRRGTIEKLAAGLDVGIETLLEGVDGTEGDASEAAPLGAAAPPSPEMRGEADDALRYFLAAVEGKLATHELATDPGQLLFVHAAVRALGWERVSQLPGDLHYRVKSVLRALNAAGEGRVNFEVEVRNLEAQRDRTPGGIA